MCQPLTVGAALEIETPGQWVMMLPLDRDEKLCWIGRLWLATGIKNLQPAITLFSGGRARHTMMRSLGFVWRRREDLVKIFMSTVQRRLVMGSAASLQWQSQTRVDCGLNGRLDGMCSREMGQGQWDYDLSSYFSQWPQILTGISCRYIERDNKVLSTYDIIDCILLIDSERRKEGKDHSFYLLSLNDDRYAFTFSWCSSWALEDHQWKSLNWR